MVYLLMSFLSLSLFASSSRPNRAITIQDHPCVCQDTRALNSLNCANFCVSKYTDGAEILFLNYTVSEEISLSPLKDVAGWCHLPMTEGGPNALCSLEAKDALGKKYSFFALAVGNSTEVNITSLPKEKRYTFTLVEESSQAQSKTKSFKISY